MSAVINAFSKDPGRVGRLISTPYKNAKPTREETLISSQVE